MEQSQGELERPVETKGSVWMRRWLLREGKVCRCRGAVPFGDRAVAWGRGARMLGCDGDAGWPLGFLLPPFSLAKE